MKDTYSYLEADAAKSISHASRHGISTREAKAAWLSTHKMNNTIAGKFHDSKEYEEIWKKALKSIATGAHQ